VIKIQVNYFQKVTMSSCKAHFSLLDKVVSLVFFQNGEKIRQKISGLFDDLSLIFVLLQTIFSEYRRAAKKLNF
jgi:hypothetical protein